MLEFSRILTALGASLAGTAFTVYGIAHAVRNDPGWEVSFGFWGTIIGLVAVVIGLIMHKQLAED